MKKPIKLTKGRYYVGDPINISYGKKGNEWENELFEKFYEGNELSIKEYKIGKAKFLAFPIEDHSNEINEIKTTSKIMIIMKKDGLAKFDGFDFTVNNIYGKTYDLENDEILKIDGISLEIENKFKIYF